MADEQINQIVEHLTKNYESDKTGGKGDQKDVPSIETPKAVDKKTKQQNPTISNIVADWQGIDKKIIDLPLRPVILTFVLKDVNIAVANAFRRILMDELLSPRFSVKSGTYHSTDPFMTEHFVRSRIESIPLVRILNPDVQKMKFKLHVKNSKSSAAERKNMDTRLSAANSVVSAENASDTMIVYAKDIIPTSGKVPGLIMNLNNELAELQEETEIKIDEIFIEYGYGRVHGSFATATNGSIKSLDIERYKDTEINSKNGKAMYGSGYKISSLVAESRLHEVSVTLRMMDEYSKDIHAKELLRNTCDTLVEYSDIVRKAERQFSTIQVKIDGLLTNANLTKIICPGMTDTICHVVSRYVDELIPERLHVSPECIPHKANIEIPIIHQISESEINKKIDDTFDYIVTMIKSLKAQI